MTEDDAEFLFILHHPDSDLVQTRRRHIAATRDFVELTELTGRFLLQQEKREVYQSRVGEIGSRIPDPYYRDIAAGLMEAALRADKSRISKADVLDIQWRLLEQEGRAYLSLLSTYAPLIENEAEYIPAGFLIPEQEAALRTRFNRVFRNREQIQNFLEEKGYEVIEIQENVREKPFFFTARFKKGEALKSRSETRNAKKLAEQFPGLDADALERLETGEGDFQAAVEKGWTLEKFSELLGKLAAAGGIRQGRRVKVISDPGAGFFFNQDRQTGTVTINLGNPRWSADRILLTAAYIGTHEAIHEENSADAESERRLAGILHSAFQHFGDNQTALGVARAEDVYESLIKEAEEVVTDAVTVSRLGKEILNGLFLFLQDALVYLQSHLQPAKVPAEYLPFVFKLMYRTVTTEGYAEILEPGNPLKADFERMSNQWAQLAKRYAAMSGRPGLDQALYGPMKYLFDTFYTGPRSEARQDDVVKPEDASAAQEGPEKASNEPKRLFDAAVEVFRKQLKIHESGLPFRIQMKPAYPQGIYFDFFPRDEGMENLFRAAEEKDQTDKIEVPAGAAGRAVVSIINAGDEKPAFFIEENMPSYALRKLKSGLGGQERYSELPRFPEYFRDLVIEASRALEWPLVYAKPKPLAELQNPEMGHGAGLRYYNKPFRKIFATAARIRFRNYFVSWDDVKKNNQQSKKVYGVSRKYLGGRAQLWRLDTASLRTNQSRLSYYDSETAADKTRRFVRKHGKMTVGRGSSIPGTGCLKTPLGMCPIFLPQCLFV